MAPKPRPVPRKVSNASVKDVPAAPLSEKEAAKAMPPPPNPPAPTKILEAEMNGLSSCLKNIAVKTGQVYAFFADTNKLGIQKHAPKPPRSLTASLGREVEKYDQFCDSIESQLLQAIAVLQRDLGREERRIKEAETASISSRTRSKSASLSPTSSRIPLPPVSDAVPTSEPIHTALPTPTNSPPAPGSSVPPGRRPSAISISSLHRPAFPSLKLDLSSSALRFNAEEASTMFQSGLASPVTLAPKSARAVGPNEFPPELMMAIASASSASDLSNRSVDIDLTLPDTDQSAGTDLAGNSADKPIELDLDAMDIDMADLFGDSGDANSASATNAGDGLFSPVDGEDSKSIKEEENFLHALGVAQNGANGHNLFATPTQAPSPGSILANLPSPSHFNNSVNGSSHDAPFDLQSFNMPHLSPGFFANTQDSEMNFSMDMSDFLNMGGSEDKGPGDETKAEPS